VIQQKSERRKSCNQETEGRGGNGASPDANRIHIGGTGEGAKLQDAGADSSIHALIGGRNSRKTQEVNFVRQEKKKKGEKAWRRGKIRALSKNPVATARFFWTYGVWKGGRKGGMGGLTKKDATSHCNIVGWN